MKESAWGSSQIPPEEKAQKYKQQLDIKWREEKDSHHQAEKGVVVRLEQC